jgi:hypothetical protein
LDTSASLLLLVSMLMSDDFPTFERPITASSGYLSGGHWVCSTLLLMNLAVFTRTFSGVPTWRGRVDRRPCNAAA